MIKFGLINASDIKNSSLDIFSKLGKKFKKTEVCYYSNNYTQTDYCEYTVENDLPSFGPRSKYTIFKEKKDKFDDFWFSNNSYPVLITMNVDNVEDFFNNNKSYKISLKGSTFRAVEYGYFPQERPELFLRRTLGNAFKRDELRETGNVYKIDDKICKEYEFNGRRYVRIQTKKKVTTALLDDVYKDKVVWAEVKPIVWLYDKEKKMFVTSKLLNSVPTNNIDFYLSKTFPNEIIQSSEYYRKQNEKKGKNSKFKNLNNVSKEQLETEIDELKKQEEESKKKQEIWLKNLLDSINALAESSTELERLGDHNTIQKNLHRLVVEDSILFKIVNDHFEIRDEFLPVLRFLNMQYNTCNFVKVSGIDWSQTNYSFNPQKVYNRDLSNTKCADHNILYADFDGVNLCGADISEESMPINLSSAIIDQNTKLPSIKMEAVR